MAKATKISLEEWWYKGCFIRLQNHTTLGKYIVYKDNEDQDHIGVANKMDLAKNLCELNEVLDPKLGLEAFGIKPKGRKLKRFRIISYYRGCELDLICITTSMRLAAEIFNIGLYHMNGYCQSTNIEEKEESQNLIPNQAYAKCGMGGEVRYFMESKKIMLYTEAKSIISAHREICKTYQETIEWSNEKMK
jgi:hypothetical protein